MESGGIKKLEKLINPTTFGKTFRNITRQEVGSNKGPSNPDYLALVQKNRHFFNRASLSKNQIPSDMVISKWD
jgi:K+-transporting ATPase c subunit